MSMNWAKDGLDAYLAVTGERRAQKQSEADLEYKKMGMQLSLNQDERAATSAGLSNQAAQLNIDEGRRKATDRSMFSGALQDFITMKTAADPSVPNTLDPAELATSRQTASDLARTAQMLNNIPPGAAELNMQSLPPAAQKVLMEGPGKAAAMRAGIAHSDPATGQTYTMTGEMGPVRIVREEGKPAMVIPTMLAKNADGTMREVPYTEGKSNGANDPVKYVTAEMLSHRAGATLTALDLAEKTGISPAVAYSQNMLKLVSSMPYEQQVAWMSGELTKESSRRERNISDAETAQAAAPYAKRIEALTGTPEEKRKAATAMMLGAPSAVADHLLKTSKAVHDLFPDVKAKGSDKTVKADVGGGQEQTLQWNEQSGRYDIPVGLPGPKHAPKADPGKRDNKEREKESRSDIDKSTSEFSRRRATFNKRRLEVLASKDPDQIKEMNAEAAQLEDESAALTEKAAQHQREFGRSYTPTMIPAKTAGGGMAPAVVTPQTRPAAAGARPALTQQQALAMAKQRGLVK